MSKRRFRLLGPTIERPDYKTKLIQIGVVNLHLKSEPIDFIELTENECLSLALDALRALAFFKGVR